jgi:hypothetical protein
MSETLHPELLSFGRRLEAVGIVAAVHADHLCVRLPLLASVRVRYDGQRLTLEPRFGVLSRTVSVLSTFGSLIALLAGMVAVEIAVPVLVMVGSLGACAVVYDGMRFIVTEGAVTRVTTLWALAGEPAAHDALGSGPAVPLASVARDSAAADLRSPRT